MIDALNLSLGNGQSYEYVRLLSHQELAARKALQFGEYTVGFVHRNKPVLLHACNLNVIKLRREWPTFDDSLHFSRIVLAGDQVYGDGRLVPAGALPDEESVLSKTWIQPVLFVCKDGLMMTTSYAVASLECDDVLPPGSFGSRPL